MRGTLLHPARPRASCDIDRACALCLAPAPGRIAGVFGPGVHRPALRALARPLLSGETAAVVDGGNLFDPYEISRQERRLGRPGGAALSRLRISRAFTCHQMEALLVRGLPAVLSREGARLAVVLGLPDPFTDADVPLAEACRLFRSCLLALRRIAAAGTRVVLVGGAEGAPGARAGFLRHLVRLADPLLLIGDTGRGHSLPEDRGSQGMAPVLVHKECPRGLAEGAGFRDERRPARGRLRRGGN